MRIALVGLGIQGHKRRAIAGKDVVVTVDVEDGMADYKTIEQVPSYLYDAALVCTPDSVKVGVLRHLLSLGKHVLVEKPLLIGDSGEGGELAELARSNNCVCYTAYNHRFEPHIAALKELLDESVLGDIYMGQFFYGNGTARNTRESPWRDQGAGVLVDLGSHLLDMALFLFGEMKNPFELWGLNNFENNASDHVLFGYRGEPFLQFEATLLSWRNTFRIDLYGELGSAHIEGLCKWGPSSLVVRKRIFPSGKPDEERRIIEKLDPTWEMEYRHFLSLCTRATSNMDNDFWINETLGNLARQGGVQFA